MRKASSNPKTDTKAQAKIRKAMHNTNRWTTKEVNKAYIWFFASQRQRYYTCWQYHMQDTAGWQFLGYNLKGALERLKGMTAPMADYLYAEAGNGILELIRKGDTITLRIDNTTSVDVQLSDLIRALKEINIPMANAEQQGQILHQLAEIQDRLHLLLDLATIPQEKTDG